jgi:hypothetical protein
LLDVSYVLSYGKNVLDYSAYDNSDWTSTTQTWFSLYLKGAQMIGGPKASILSCAEPLSSALPRQPSAKSGSVSTQRCHSATAFA